ncbi:hypothetical protein M422DRAFT_32310 [Sphaerobolus stellatus SS14]|uniref:Potassium transport protein n=1 Tax=Sphaerobolus stellatus (strain SS14) TaxID=990650 RepID=A0A0C9VFN9_SPHS4|nr:hypothetical protein M422DRAFT_32310 [Sphaerobolus stellatus SS14]
MTAVVVEDNEEPPANTKLGSLKAFIVKEATFFRVHLTCFTLIPLIASGVFYACNGQFRVNYIDSLFLCYSAMTVTGLSTINLSTTTAWQQVILYLLMGIGDITVGSWIMVLIRKHYFKTECIRVEKEEREEKERQREQSFKKKLLRRSKTTFKKYKTEPVKHNNDMLDLPVIPTSPNGHAHHSMLFQSPESHRSTFSPPAGPGPVPLSGTGRLPMAISPKPFIKKNRSLPDFTVNTLNASPSPDELPLPGISSESSRSGRFWTGGNRLYSSPRTEILSLHEHEGYESPVSPGAGTITFAEQEHERSTSRRRLTTIKESVPYSRPSTILGPSTRRSKGAPFPLITTTSSTAVDHHDDSERHHYDPRYHGLGGFPGPFTIVQKLFPDAYRKVERKLTMWQVTPILPTIRHGSEKDGEKKRRLIGLGGVRGLVVKRNSFFETDELSDEELETIGGVEYRALRLLGYLVAFYFVGMQVLTYLLFAPWLSATKQYDGVFEQARLVKKPWFALFQVMGAYTGGGLSLVDEGMIPFQRAYLMIFALMFVILAGNHALPIFLRLLIWIGSKLVKPDSKTDQALTFLLQHPRRCFIYLFPSPQTWFLVVCLLLFSAIEWVAFLVLNIGLDVTQSLPVGTRIIDGLFQGLAARASGFSIVGISSLAPAVQFLYAVMMYIAVYPVAMTIRSTNVYEERSLGVFEEPEFKYDEPAPEELTGTRRERIGKYLHWHFRKQMSIDLWWLIWGVFFVCIIERGNLLDQSKKWFDIFRVLFELVSAFGGIGLSLGVPYDNFSFTGSFKPLSKLVVIIIMVRGRHRGLPLAVDRAILLPREFQLIQQEQQNQHQGEGPQQGEGQGENAHVYFEKNGNPQGVAA